MKIVEIEGVKYVEVTEVVAPTLVRYNEYMAQLKKENSPVTTAEMKKVDALLKPAVEPKE